MLDFQRQFLRFAIESEVLRFGEFNLKSGRKSPYFFNAGLFNTGQALSRLGDFYADAIVHAELEFDVLFGPAYKGIPLVSAVAIALYQNHARSVPWIFNRKEVKQHGEGGSLVGAQLQGRVLVIDDVITAGTAIRESLTLIEQSGATLSGVCVSIDRQERGQGAESAIQEIEREHQVAVVTIATLDTLIEFLRERDDQHDILKSIVAYQQEFGAIRT